MTTDETTGMETFVHDVWGEVTTCERCETMTPGTIADHVAERHADDTAPAFIESPFTRRAKAGLLPGADLTGRIRVPRA